MQEQTLMCNGLSIEGQKFSNLFLKMNKRLMGLTLEYEIKTLFLEYSSLHDWAYDAFRFWNRLSMFRMSGF